MGRKKGVDARFDPWLQGLEGGEESSVHLAAYAALRGVGVGLEGVDVVDPVLAMRGKGGIVGVSWEYRGYRVDRVVIEA